MQRKQADTILVQFREHPDSWTRVDAILEQAKNVDTKVTNHKRKKKNKSKLLHTQFYALQILEPLIATRWKILPREQCEGIKNFVVGLIIKLSSDEAVMQQNKFFLTKLDLTLVQVRPTPDSMSAGFIGLVLLLDPQARLAPQLAHVHLGRRRLKQDQRDAVREQHDYFPLPQVCAQCLCPPFESA